MKSNYRKHDAEAVSIVLLSISVVLAVLVVVEVTSFFAASARANNMMSKAVTPSETANKVTEKYAAEAKSVADKLKKSNLFAPPPPRENPVKEVFGILGSEALINGKWCKVGDSVGDAKVIAIEPTRVKVAWNGQENAFLPISAAGSGGSGGPRGGPAGPPMEGRRGAEMVVVPRGMRGPGGEGRFQMPSAEERARMRERFANMSEEERQAFREQMRGRGGGRRGGE